MKNPTKLVRINAQAYDKVKEVAERDNTTIGRILLEALALYLKRYPLPRWNLKKTMAGRPARKQE